MTLSRRLIGTHSNCAIVLERIEKCKIIGLGLVAPELHFSVEGGAEKQRLIRHREKNKLSDRILVGRADTPLGRIETNNIRMAFGIRNLIRITTQRKSLFSMILKQVMFWFWDT